MKFSDFIQSDLSKLSHYLLLGNPVIQSLSPEMHNLALKHNKLGGEYYAVSVTARDLNMAIAHFTNDAFLGANVTIPHKELFLDVVDELTEEAAAIGAMNTIIKQDNKLIGHNTDAYGFMKPIEEYYDELAGEKVVIFGSGGATKAIVYALRKAGVAELILVSRRPEMHKDSNEGDIVRCSYANWTAYAEDAAMIVNATPLGMTPNEDRSPVDEQDEAILEGKICYDIVYNPRTTKFMKQASNNGGIAIGGLGMLIHQGAASFKHWTGLEFPINKIEQQLDVILPA